MTKRQILLLYMILFSGLGSFSFLLLLNNTEISHSSWPALNPYWVLALFILVFNILGLSLLHINHYIDRKAPFFFAKRSRVIIHYIVISLLLCLLNYTLFFSMKLLLDFANPFVIRADGVRTLNIIWLVELVILGLVLVNNSFRFTIGLYREKAQLEESALKAQYMALQSQLNPHFLFNSLNVLISEIEYNPQNAVQFTRNLSDVYRYILQHQEQMLVTLKEELAFVDAYLFLHRVRLGDCIRIEHAIDRVLYDRKLPPLTLQLLVENVIKHNSISLNKLMLIKLSYIAEEEMLEISNPIRPKQGALESGKGLQNLATRYQLLCSKKIEIIQSENCFTVKIPLLNE